MTDDYKLLNYIYRASELNRNSWMNIIPKIKDTDLQLTLRNQLKGYNSFFKLSENDIKLIGERPRPENDISKGLSQVLTNINSLNVTPSHIAQVLIKSSDSEVKNMNNKILDYKNVNEETKRIANDYVNHHKNIINDLERFL